MVVLAALLLSAAPNEDLARAQKAFDELKYADAAKALDAAWATPGNDLETVVEVLRLQAVVAAVTGQPDRARALFKSLLYLAPAYVLPEGDLGPKVMSLYYEAKGRVGADGSLKLEAGAPVRDTSTVHRLTLKVTDPQQLAKTARVHLRAPGYETKTLDAPLTDGGASFDVALPRVEWWAELLGDKDRMLARLGSADQPNTTEKASLTPRSDGPPPAAAAAQGTNLKPFAYAVAGAGVAAAIVGAVFGVSANGTKALVENAARDGSGRVTGITRATALQLNEQQKTSALLANTLFVASGVLVAGGVALFALSPEVKVSAGGGGFAVGGSW